MKRKTRILFFGEPATLAHVVRPIVLARALDQDTYDVTLATGPDFRYFAEDAGLKVRNLWTIGTRAYLSAVAAGRPVFPYPILRRYMEDDLHHIDAVQPDLIVGDFRLSLAVSSRLAKIPYLAISNAYWSPFAPVKFDIPVHPSTRLLGVTVANAAFQWLSPLIFAQHSLPMHRLRRHYGMPSLGFDLRGVFTEADTTLFADVPELVPTRDSGLGENRYRYIGPVVWSPAGELPAELQKPNDGRPLIYIAMGSSGDARLLRDLIGAALSAGARIIVATGTDRNTTVFPTDVITAPFLPGAAVAALADLVICNGGSPSTHQALQQGTPVLGIPANLDQLLNMQFIAASGAGLALRADQVSFHRIRNAVSRLLLEVAFQREAKTVATWFRRYQATERFAICIRQHLG